MSAAPVAPPAGAFEELSTELRFRSRGRTITEADVVAFSALTGDRHPQHADAEWAAASPFGERIVHGALVLSCALGLLQLDPIHAVALRRIGEIRFKRPVKIGDTIRVEGRLTELRPVDATVGLVTVACTVLAHGASAVGFSAEVVWRREPTLSRGGGTVDL